jgi:hypothetical protein
MLGIWHYLGLHKTIIANFGTVLNASKDKIEF